METKQAISAGLVEEFVLKAHADLERIRELLAQEPGLLNASHDWGAGDWETGLGAAAHMGRHDIARFLLDQGARIDLFAAAMLGELDLVKATLQAFPMMRNGRGAHGIPLIEHARAGGPAAEHVLQFLEESAG